MSATVQEELEDLGVAEFGECMTEVRGFHPDSTGLENVAALQRALDQGGEVRIEEPGVYRMGGTVLIGSHTKLIFGPGVKLMKVDERGPFSHVILNKGALTRTFDEGIEIHGLEIVVNGMDERDWVVFGLHGHLALFYVKRVKISGFRILDLATEQFAIQVCTFEDLLIEDVEVRGNKDGVHLGRGKRFVIRRGVFQTFDDAVALNAHDYDVSNPELGWIEDGVVEQCHDLDADSTTGFFCRMIGGSWLPWKSGMELQKSDTVIHDGCLYRVRAEPDGKIYRSLTAPTHKSGAVRLDGITWQHVQKGEESTAGVRNVTFRDIFLHKARVGFSIHGDMDRWSRSYYPGATVQPMSNVWLERVVSLHEVDFLLIRAALEDITLVGCRFGAGGINFFDKPSAAGRPTRVSLLGCSFSQSGPMLLLKNRHGVPSVSLTSANSVVLGANFEAQIEDPLKQCKANLDVPIAL